MIWGISYIYNRLSMETYQPYLDLRRTELGLRYLVKKQTNSSNQWDAVEKPNDAKRMMNQNRNIHCEVKYNDMPKEICKGDAEP